MEDVAQLHPPVPRVCATANFTSNVSAHASEGKLDRAAPSAPHPPITSSTDSNRCALTAHARAVLAMARVPGAPHIPFAQRGVAALTPEQRLAQSRGARGEAQRQRKAMSDKFRPVYAEKYRHLPHTDPCSSPPVLLPAVASSPQFNND